MFWRRASWLIDDQRAEVVIINESRFRYVSSLIPAAVDSKNDR
jgi:hypothetical protein